MENCRNLMDMSPKSKRLVEMMLEINFGQIERIRITGGQPDFEPAPLVIRDIVFGKENKVHPIRSIDDFALKKQVIELFEYFEELGDGIVHSITIRNGLPVCMKLEKSFRD